MREFKNKELMQEKNLRKLEDEVWKHITFADKYYEVSNYGRIKSFCYDKDAGKILKHGDVKGFPSVSFMSNGKKTTFLIHKITAHVFTPKPSPKHDTVIHLDWNKKNNHIRNLKWVTREESYSRMMKRLKEINKTKNKGIIRYSKLKATDVKLLKSMLERGVRQNMIARMFCISEMQVTRIKRGENWAHV